MMKLEDQVCSLELSKRLKDFDVKQDSFFYWGNHDEDLTLKIYPHLPDKEYLRELDSIYSGGCGCCADFFNVQEIYSAFSVAEIGAMLPDCLYSKTASGSDNPIFMNKVGDLYSVAVLNPNRSLIPRFIDTNEANARAMMLIWLIEQWHVKP